MRWLRTDDGIWVNLRLAVQIRFEPDKATIWFLDGSQSTASGDLAGLRAWVEGTPPKDNLVSAYRAR